MIKKWLKLGKQRSQTAVRAIVRAWRVGGRPPGVAVRACRRHVSRYFVASMSRLQIEIINSGTTRRLSESPVWMEKHPMRRGKCSVELDRLKMQDSHLV